jgi:hypothetical protein
MAIFVLLLLHVLFSKADYDNQEALSERGPM